MASKEMITAIKLTPLRRKHIPSPTVAMRNPAMEGPTNLDSISQVLPAFDQVDNERLTHRDVKGIDQAQNKAENNDVPNLNAAGQNEESQDEGLQH
jgi:hypothetical protein